MKVAVGANTVFRFVARRLAATILRCCSGSPGSSSWSADPRGPWHHDRRKTLPGESDQARHVPASTTLHGMRTSVACSPATWVLIADDPVAVRSALRRRRPSLAAILVSLSSPFREDSRGLAVPAVDCRHCGGCGTGRQLAASCPPSSSVRLGWLPASGRGPAAGLSVCPHPRRGPPGRDAPCLAGGHPGSALPWQMC
jgi:hypothetical protein